jgi:phage baseplate assembly protein W
MYISYPFQISNGQTAQADMTSYVEQLIEQLLCTSPGERVNRPDLGSGLMQLVFTPNSDALATTFEFLIQGILQAYLGSLIQLSSLTVNNVDDILSVTVQYMILATQQQKTTQINTPVTTTPQLRKN